MCCTSRTRVGWPQSCNVARTLCFKPTESLMRDSYHDSRIQSSFRATGQPTAVERRRQYSPSSAARTVHHHVVRATYVVDVPAGGRAAAHPRLEIRTLLSDPIQRTLFLRAYLSYQNRSANAPDSYFQAAGIHGLPYTPFDGVDPMPGVWPKPRPNGNSNDLFGGYCQHGTQLFPIWHRPYVLMVEREICKEAVRLAAGYQNVQYRQTAEELRFPYFDWAINDGSNAVSSVLLDHLFDDTVTVENERGQAMDIRNPLASFTLTQRLVHYQPVGNDSGSDSGPVSLLTTVRHPVRNASGLWQSSRQSFASTMGRNLAYVRARVLNILLGAADRNWVCFSNHSATRNGQDGAGDPSRYFCYGQDSLEGIHDTIHNILAGPWVPGTAGNYQAGHIGDPNYASFDPIFFLHHCNIDRLMAIWETLNPTEGLDPSYAETDGEGTFTNPPAQPEATIPAADAQPDASAPMTPLQGKEYWNDNSPQYPFRARAAPDQFWAPKDVMINKQLQPAESTKFLGYYYPELATRADSSPPALARKVRELYSDAPEARQDFTALRFHSLSRNLLPSSFMVQVYLKAAKEEDFVLDEEHYAGSIASFKRTDSSRCSNCQTRSDTIFGDVPLNPAMERLGITLEQLQEKGAAESLVKVVVVGQGTTDSSAVSKTGPVAILTKKLGEPSAVVLPQIQAAVQSNVRSFVPFSTRVAFSDKVDSVWRLVVQPPVSALELDGFNAEHV